MASATHHNIKHDLTPTLLALRAVSQSTASSYLIHTEDDHYWRFWEQLQHTTWPNPKSQVTMTYVVKTKNKHMYNTMLGLYFQLCLPVDLHS
jgi:hypothetical protein